jgi:hypothetical protein
MEQKSVNEQDPKSWLDAEINSRLVEADARLAGADGTVLETLYEEMRMELKEIRELLKPCFNVPLPDEVDVVDGVRVLVADFRTLSVLKAKDSVETENVLAKLEQKLEVIHVYLGGTEGEHKGSLFTLLNAVAAKVEARDRSPIQKHDEVAILKARVAAQDEAVIELAKKLNDAEVRAKAAQAEKQASLTAAIECEHCSNPAVHFEEDRRWCEAHTPWSGHYEFCSPSSCKETANANPGMYTATELRETTARLTFEVDDLREKLREADSFAQSAVHMKELDDAEIARLMVRDLEAGTRIELQRQRLMEIKDVVPLATAFAVLLAHGFNDANLSAVEAETVSRAKALLGVSS